MSDKELNDPTEIRYENPVKAFGFAMLYHATAWDKRVSDGAYRCYAVLLAYAQQKGKAWPTRETIAAILDKEVRTISRYYDELESAGYIRRQRRKNTSSITWIKDAEENEGLCEVAESVLLERDKNVTSSPEHDIDVTTDVTKMSPPDMTKMSSKEESFNNNKPKEEVKRETRPPFDDLDQHRTLIALPEIVLYRKVTSRTPAQDQMETIYDALHGNPVMTEPYLRKFWKAWRDRDYKRGNLGWLEWAVSGVVPNASKNGHAPRNGASRPSAAERLAHRLQEIENGN